MIKVHKIKVVIPFLILCVLIGILYRELFYAKPDELPSALIGQPLPPFKLSNIGTTPTLNFTQNSLTGRVSLLNVWATWCQACKIEHKMLMKIKDDYRIPIYGIAYKDDTLRAQNWLTKTGNPYVLVGNDVDGNVAIDLGIYGTPETFVISPAGKIIYRHIGVLDQKTWDTVIFPLVQQYA